MNSFRLMMRKILKARFYVGLFLVGLIFLVAGIVVMVLPNKATAEASATITNITEDWDDINETTDYTVDIVFTDSKGIIHSATLHAYETGWKAGSQITIKYNPESPEEISYGNVNIFPYIMIAVGVIAVLGSLVKFILIAKTKSSDTDEFNQVDLNNVPKEKIEEISNSDEPEKKYYFHFTSGLKTSYVMETNPDRKKVFEAVSQKLSFFTSYQYNFVNHQNGKEELKKCSHTVTTSYGEGNVDVKTNANFKIDGVNCFKALGATGYSLEPHMEGLHVSFDVFKYGVKVAYFEQTGTNAAMGKNYKLGNIATPGIYDVTCRESDVEGVFLACFIVARTFDL